ncbi:MAG: serine/threonine-protein phosphatase, partial [Phycisphaerales bacterium]|nr:serine/threonine-protein phosphatase [Phycisphaerales bacterium]
MRELGGDYVHLLVDRAGGVHLTLLDVTGHGLAAALTVNRLSGEIERLRAERPDIDPDALLVALNRYVHLTLRRRHVFATAFCASLDPSTGHLAWANAGHPPAFLRRADGRVEELAATGVLLGALEDDDFVPRTTTLDPGDVLVVYTDGVFEARNRRGQALGLAALRELMQRSPPPRDWTVHLDTIVRAHVAGQPDDDVLIASLAFLKARPAIEADDHEATMTTATTEAAS